MDTFEEHDAHDIPDAKDSNLLLNEENTVNNNGELEHDLCANIEDEVSLLVCNHGGDDDASLDTAELEQTQSLRDISSMEETEKNDGALKNNPNNSANSQQDDLDGFRDNEDMEHITEDLSLDETFVIDASLLEEIESISMMNASERCMDGIATSLALSENGIHTLQDSCNSEDIWNISQQTNEVNGEQNDIYTEEDSEQLLYGATGGNHDIDSKEIHNSKSNNHDEISHQSASFEYSAGVVDADSIDRGCCPDS